MLETQAMPMGWRKTRRVVWRRLRQLAWVLGIAATASGLMVIVFALLFFASDALGLLP